VRRTHRLSGTDLARCWAAFASLGAGLVHLAVTREHLAEWWVYGVFFAVVGAAQVAWAVAALGASGHPPLRRPVAVGNAALVLLWLLTRTSGLPVGPERWSAEAFGRPDVLCVVLELAAVGVLLLLHRVWRDAGRLVGRLATGRFVALMFAGALTVSAVTTPALAATESGANPHHHLGGR
jgi:hypothetical protein